jgi:hypothetical protein
MNLYNEEINREQMEDMISAHWFSIISKLTATADFEEDLLQAVDSFLANSSIDELKEEAHHILY